MDSTQAYTEPDWLTISEAAAVCGVHPETLRRAEAAGRISSSRTPGGHRRFNRADVERLITPAPQESAS